jgi:hypothetical protein
MFAELFHFIVLICRQNVHFFLKDEERVEAASNKFLFLSERDEKTWTAVLVASNATIFKDIGIVFEVNLQCMA